MLLLHTGGSVLGFRGALRTAAKAAVGYGSASANQAVDRDPEIRDKYKSKVYQKKMEAASRESAQSGLRKAKESTIRSSSVSSSSSSGSVSSNVSTGRSTQNSFVIANGASDLIKYVKLRKLECALIITVPLSSPLLGSDDDSQFQLQEFMAQLGHDFGVIHEVYEQPRSSAPLVRACGRMGIETSRVMCLGSDLAFLQASRDASCLAVQLRHQNARRSSHAHQYCDSFFDFQTIVEQYNGVSYRSTDPYLHSTTYGPGE